MDPRPADLEGLEVGLFVMTLGAHRAPRGRAAFEFVGAQVPQPRVQAAGVVPGFHEREDGHACFGRVCCKVRRTGVNCLRRLERGVGGMSDFKGRHFGSEIVLWAVRWYCRYRAEKR